MLGPREAVQELILPLRSMDVLPTLVVFSILFAIVDAAGLFGLWLLLVIVPAFARYLLFYLEARSRDRMPEVLGIEHFSWMGNAWSLFPLVPIAAFVLLTGVLVLQQERALAWLVGVVALCVLPASFAVLAITHSPLQSLNPVAVGRLAWQCRGSYWLAPVTLLAAVWVSEFLPALPGPVADFAGLALVVMTFGMMGAMLRPHGVVDDLYIPSVDVDDDEQRPVNESFRRTAVGHAYGFASRGNLDGALKHLRASIAEDADPASAWSWYFEQMLAWEDRFPAMKFAQLYVSALLAEDRYREVNKLVMRCLHVDEHFRPLPDELPTVLEILRQSGNEAMAARMVR